MWPFFIRFPDGVTEDAENAVKMINKDKTDKIIFS